MRCRSALFPVLAATFAGLAALAPCLAFASAAANAGIPATLEPQVDAFVAKYERADNSGLALGVVKGGQLVYFKGYGYRDRAKKLPVTAATLFAIGSNTKAFTSLAISMLAEAGKANLETPLQAQLPGFAMSDAQVTSKITPVDMMSHRTGLPRHDLLWYLTPFSRFELFKKIPFLALNRHAGLGFREGFQYNNLMFMTIGVWIEALTRQTWESFVGHRILAPLGMTSTNFSIAGIQSAPDFARPYEGNTSLEFRDIQPIGPAGSINSSVNDLTKWLAFQLRHGKTATGRALVSEATHERLFKKESDASATFPGGESVGYGLGWFLSDINGHRVIWHGGNIDGFSSFVSFVPDSDLAVIILTNESDASAFEFPITVPATAAHPDIKLLPLVIYDELLPGGQTPMRTLGEAAAPWLARASTGWLDARHSLLNLRALERDLGSRVTQADSVSRTAGAGVANVEYVGAFSEAAYGNLVVRQSARGLELDYYDNHFGLVAAAGADAFTFTLQAAGETATVPLKFRRDSSGVVSGVAIPMEPSVDDIVFVRAKH